MRFVRHDQGEGASPEQLPLVGDFRHAFCVAEESGSDAYAQATRGYRAVPSSDAAEYHIACCADRHRSGMFLHL